MTDFQQQIRNAYEHLTNIQRTIADYFLEHLDTIPFKRLEELADLIGVSTTSVIRFTRSIGYQGYGDMQQELQQSIFGKASLPERLKSSIQAEGDNHLLLRTFQTDVDNIQETLSVLSETVLSEAVSSYCSGKKCLYHRNSRQLFCGSLFGVPLGTDQAGSTFGGRDFHGLSRAGHRNPA